MRSWILSIVVAGLAACGELFGLAHAADLSVAPAYVSPPVVAPVPVCTWTGVYVGVNGGYGFGQSTPMSLFSDTFSAFSYNANGWLGGVTVGAQLQNGHTVLGLEADIDWANIKGSSSGTVNFNGAPIGTATLSSTLSSISTARARAGYAYDNWLFFVTGGLAMTNQT